MSTAAAHVKRQSVHLPSRGVMMEADLVIPDGAQAFAKHLRPPVHGGVARGHRGGHAGRLRGLARVRAWP